MRQLLQNLHDGKTLIADVPASGYSGGNILISVTRSLVSAGTERMLLDFGKAGWIGKARAQPEKVRAVLNKVRADGAFATWQAIRAKLEQPIPLGYCTVGVIVGCDEAQEDSRKQDKEAWPQVGDRVVSNGPHAEVVSVSQRLCAKIPDAVSDDAATFTPLAAIAWEGIGLLNVGVGDRVVVTGLGLIGQLAVRILRSIGCEVLGLDPAADRRARAEKYGAQTVPADADPVAAALSWSRGAGVAGVLITASTASHAVVNQAARSCRYRGRVVLVGVVGLQLNRADFYRNEVSFQVSCSYGRRDHCEAGSAQANFKQVLEWMAQGKLPVEDLITHRFAFSEALAAYERLGDRSALGILLEYAAAGQSRKKEEEKEQAQKTDDGRFSRTVVLRDAAKLNGAPRVALIGAGNFAGRTLLPALARLDLSPALQAVASNHGHAAYLLADKFGAARATTDSASIFADKAVDAVFIATRHNDHVSQTMKALGAGKCVWVEKPLCLSLDELKLVERVMGSRLLDNRGESTNREERVTDSRVPPKPILMVGFNRRFSPLAVRLHVALNARPCLYRIRIVVNAGRLDPDHWTLDPRVGGGRIVGEGCHFIDLARYLAASPITNVQCTRRDADGQDGGCFEMQFENGSSATVDYRTDLPAHVPKEIIDVSGEGFAARIHNWAKLSSDGLGGLAIGSFWSRAPRKGHPEALEAFLAAVRSNRPGPIPLEEIFEVSRWAVIMQGMAEGEVRRSDGAEFRTTTRPIAL